MGERCKLPQWGPGQSPNDLALCDLAIFVDFDTQEVILGAIQSESSSTRILVQRNCSI